MSVNCFAAVLVRRVLTDPDIWWPPYRTHGLCFYSYGKHVAAKESVIQASTPDDITRIFIVCILQVIYFFTSELTEYMDFTFVDTCIIVQFIKKKSNKMQQPIKILLFHIYVKLNMFRATYRPSSGA